MSGARVQIDPSLLACMLPLLFGVDNFILFLFFSVVNDDGLCISSFHCLDMTLAVAEALNPNKLFQKFSRLDDASVSSPRRGSLTRHPSHTTISISP